MFASGLLLIVVALALVVASFVLPSEARIGLLGGALGCGLAGLLIAYLDAPSRKAPPPAGKQRAKARILAGSGTTGSVAGYQMIELTLEVLPKGGVPFQTTRRFSAGRFGRIEAGEEIEVLFDPADPERIELG